MNKIFSILSKYSTWIALVVFLITILGTFQGLFLNNLSNVPNAPGWSMEYNWSVYVANGINLYPEEPSFVEGQSLAYMPLYFLVVGNLMKIFGMSTVVGKVVSTLAVLGISLVIYKIGVRLTKKRLLSIVPGVLFLLYPMVSNYTSEQMKIDMLGLFFTTLSLYLVLSRRYLWAVPFAVLSLFTKQYFVVLPVAVTIYLALKDRETLVKYIGLYSVLAGIGFGLGQYLTGGTFFTHTVLYLFSAPDFTTLGVERTLAGTLISLGYLLPVLILAVYGMRKTRTFGLLGTYLVVALLVLGVTISKVGSGINYTFDTLVVSCCLSTLAFKSKGSYR